MFICKSFRGSTLLVCCCSWTDLALSSLLQPLCGLGYSSAPLGLGWRDRRPRPQTHVLSVSAPSHRCPPLDSASSPATFLVSSCLLGFSWNSLQSEGFSLSRFVPFCSLLPVTPSSSPAQSRFFSPAPTSPLYRFSSLQWVVGERFRKAQGHHKRCFPPWLGLSLLSWVTGTQSPAEGWSWWVEILQGPRKMDFH